MRGHTTRAATLDDRLERWRSEIIAWRTPDEIVSRSAPYPVVGRRLPRNVGAVDSPPQGSRSYARAVEALPAGGSVLDVGAGAGGASLPLASRLGLVVGVDTSAEQLAALEARAGALGIRAQTVVGEWPAAADLVEAADLVICHHVLFSIADLQPFIEALSARSQRRVVVEIPMRHPEWPLNPLWLRFQGVERPEGPTALDLAGVIELLGLRPQVETWVDVAGWGEYESFDDLVNRTRRKLHLSPMRTGELAEALIQMGINPARPMSLGSVGRRLVTIWWDGSAT